MGLANRTRQWNFIVTFSEETTRKIHALGSKVKGDTNKQYFPYTNKKTENKVARVCREMFVNTLGNNIQWIQTAYKKIHEGNSVLVPD